MIQGIPHNVRRVGHMGRSDEARPQEDCLRFGKLTDSAIECCYATSES